MLKLFSAFRRCEPTPALGKPLEPPPPPLQVPAAGADPLELAAVLRPGTPFPLLDWAAVEQWVARLPTPEAEAQAWLACEWAWLQHLRAALGGRYRLTESGSAILLSALPPRLANTTAAFVHKTSQRILRLLDGIGQHPAWGHEILIVFEDADTYYRYVSQHQPQGGEFGASSGMYIPGGCAHFVTVRADLYAVEPVIAHELTHACVSHLNLPTWLNEGLAVNTEHHLCPRPPGGASPQALHARHRAFWGAQEIQQFWAGTAFQRADAGQALAYDLARILVSQLASDWAGFQDFVRAASVEDAGADAAAEHLGIDLGAAVCALLERDVEEAWVPAARPALAGPPQLQVLAAAVAPLQAAGVTCGTGAGEDCRWPDTLPLPLNFLQQADMPANKRIQFTAEIAAAPARVFRTMLGADSFREWTAAFAEGSHYVGSWQAGERIRFMTPSGDGMVAEIAEHRPDEFVSIRHLGYLQQGVEDTDSPAVRAWAPAYENYTLQPIPGGTRLVIDQDATPEFEAYLADAWPRALQRLKALCEADGTA